MAIHVGAIRDARPIVCSVLLGAALLTGCSTTKLASNNPKLPKVDAPPHSTTVSLPGSPEFATAESVKHPEKIHLAYGRWQEQQRQPALAREAYQKALDRDPKSIDALLGLSRLDQLAGRPADAEQHLSKAQQLQPHSAVVQAGWGEYFAAQQNWPRAIERYRQAIQLAPDEALYKHQLAVTLVKSGAVNEGFAGFVALVGQAEAHYNVGVLMYQQGRLVEAEEQLARALVLKPELAAAGTLVAKIQRERGLSPQVASAPRSAEPTPTPTPTPIVATPVPATQMAAAPPRPSTPPANNAVTPAGWIAAQPAASTQPVSFSLPNVATPQQLEQWHNQQAAGR